MDSRGIRRAVRIALLLASTIATAGQERDLRNRLTPHTWMLCKPTWPVPLERLTPHG